MKIMALGDLHGRLPKNVKSIIKKKKVELVVSVGEIPDVPFKPKKGETPKQTDKRYRKHYASMLKKLNSLGVSVLALRGNEMDPRWNKRIRKFGNIYSTKIGMRKINDKKFILFDMTFEGRGPRSAKINAFMRKMITSAPIRRKKLEMLLKKNRDAVLISHTPPYGYLDVVKNVYTNFKKKHVGSKILLNAIKKYRPTLVLCGHIHEGKGKAKIGRTVVYNLGSHGSYKILNI